jgi:hypothetical protein
LVKNLVSTHQRVPITVTPLIRRRNANEQG